MIDHISRERVAEIPIDGVEICRDIYIARNPKRILTRAQVAFWEFVQGLPGAFANECMEAHRRPNSTVSG